MRKKVKQIRNNNIIASAIRINAQISHFKSNYWETFKGCTISQKDVSLSLELNLEQQVIDQQLKKNSL